MKTVKFLLVALLFTSSATLMAQNKFGYLNSREVISLMPELDTINSQLEAYQKELTSTFEAMQTEYTTKVADFQKNTAQWTQIMNDQKVKEINSLRDNIQSYQEAAQEDSAKKQQDLMEPVFKKVQDAINVVGKENSFTYVFDTSTGTLLFIDEATAINVLPLVKTKLGITK